MDEGTPMARKQKASTLLKKGCDDAELVRHLIADGIGTDEQVGYFCQQAVEKAIKAVLETHDIAYRFTHNVAELLDALKDGSVSYPDTLEMAVELTPFASSLRYGDLPSEAVSDDTFDRGAALVWADLAIGWASGHVDPPTKT